jgi:hypothetical protein
LAAMQAERDKLAEQLAALKVRLWLRHST